MELIENEDVIHLPKTDWLKLYEMMYNVETNKVVFSSCFDEINRILDKLGNIKYNFCKACVGTHGNIKKQIWRFLLNWLAVNEPNMLKYPSDVPKPFDSDYWKKTLSIVGIVELREITAKQYLELKRQKVDNEQIIKINTFFDQLAESKMNLSFFKAAVRGGRPSDASQDNEMAMQIIRYFQLGMTNYKIAQLTGKHRTTIQNYRVKYEKTGTIF